MSLYLKNPSFLFYISRQNRDLVLVFSGKKRSANTSTAAKLTKYSEAEYESHNNKVVPDEGEQGWVNK